MGPLAVILIGPPTSGKSSIAREYASNGFNVISTGDLLRQNSFNPAQAQLTARQVSSGTLVQDNVVINLVRKKLDEPTLIDLYFFDGFPRTQPQAMALDQMLIERGIPEEKIVPILIDVSHAKLEYNHEARTHNMRVNGEKPRPDDAPAIFWDRVTRFYTGLPELQEYYGKRMERIDGDQQSQDRLAQVREITEERMPRETVPLMRGRQPPVPPQ